jgi:hypothetical protein
MYGKFWAALIYAIAITVQQALGGDGVIEASEWVLIAIAVVSVLGVYLVPITSNYKWVKSGLAVILAVLQALATVLLGGWQSNDWITLLIAGLGAVAVILAPATSQNPSGTGNVSVPFGTDH